jgi:coenzyme F420-reducing hydrogenase delta subunit
MNTPKIDIFYCANAFEEGVFPLRATEAGTTSHPVKMACSGMIKDIYILKAFESGADGVLVVGCPAGTCKRVDGNIRASKRVAFVQKLLDEIGLGSARLAYTSSDQFAAAMEQLSARIMELDSKQRSEAK